MDRRSFIRGLVAAPIVITTPGLLMPVKALPKPFAHVTGLLLNGTQFVKEIWDMRPASFIAAEPWFDDVASITSYEYTDLNPETNPYITPASVFSAFRREDGKPMLTPMQRAEYSPLRGNIKYEDWELKAFRDIDKLKEEPAHHTLDANGDKIVNLGGDWHKDPTQYLLDKAIR
jgi:hypothetical protein